MMDTGYLLFGIVTTDPKKMEANLKKRGPLPDGITNAEVQKKSIVLTAEQLLAQSEEKKKYAERFPENVAESDFELVGLDEPFELSEPEPRATATWSQSQMVRRRDSVKASVCLPLSTHPPLCACPHPPPQDAHKVEQISAENKLLDKQLEKVNAEFEELRRQQDANLIKQMQADDARERAVKRGNKPAEEKAKKEQAALEKEKEALDAKAEAKAQERKATEEKRKKSG